MVHAVAAWIFPMFRFLRRAMKIFKCASELVILVDPLLWEPARVRRTSWLMSMREDGTGKMLWAWLLSQPLTGVLAMCAMAYVMSFWLM